MDSGFCVFKGLFEMRKRVFYGSSLIKRDFIGLGGFVETEPMITSVQKSLVMLDFLVVNGMRQS